MDFEYSAKTKELQKKLLAFMEEHMTVPTMEQLTVCLLNDVLEGLGLVRRSKVLKGFPQRGALRWYLQFMLVRPVSRPVRIIAARAFRARSTA